jgi:hypothetical protein
MSRTFLEPSNPYYKFWTALKSGKPVFRDDPLNGFRGWIQPGDLPDPIDITKYGYMNLYLERPPARQLHPAYLLASATSLAPVTPPVHAKPLLGLVSETGDVEMVLAKDDAGFQLQLSSPARIKELSEALKRLLNTWDADAPIWLWQLDALLDPSLREEAFRAKIRP